ncbi:hypothetical protein HY732_02050 [Candidatus Uhrbacteria bacterium]|nr:hypothetical protein [Candidatus Uhrbacteria bacterium]
MKRIIFISLMAPIILFGTLLYFFIFGVPIHDMNLWMLKRAYSRVEHPAESKVLADAVYLGGPATHGSWRCTYVVGEVRTSLLSKQEIQDAYSFSAPLPLAILFFDDEWPGELPWFTWESEFKIFKERSDTPYLVYSAKKDIPFLGDMRCDD